MLQLHKRGSHANSFKYVYLQIVTERCFIKRDSLLLRGFIAKIIQV